MRERDPASWKREADLAGVEMPTGSDRITGRHPPRDPGEVAEEEPQCTLCAELVRLSLVTPIAVGINTHDDDFRPTLLDGHSLIP